MTGREGLCHGLGPTFSGVNAMVSSAPVFLNVREDTQRHSMRLGSSRDIRFLFVMVAVISA